MENLVPHGICLAEEPWLVGVLVMANFMIFMAYMMIPLVMWSTLKKIAHIPVFSHLSMWFAAFILLCGLTHLASVVVIYHGGYWYLVESFICIACAAISLVTLGLLWAAVPHILALFSEKQPGADNGSSSI